MVGATRRRPVIAGTGQPVGGRFTIGVRDHSYQAFTAYPDGSVA